MQEDEGRVIRYNASSDQVGEEHEYIIMKTTL